MFRTIRFNSKIVFPLLLLVLGFATRFFMLQNPAQVVFDEVHFGKFASSYFDGNYYFDIHPPLGKLLIAAGAALSGYTTYVAGHGVFDFATIGEQYGAMPYVGFRLFPALAGALLPVVLYWFLKNLGTHDWAAFGIGVLAVFDNALVVQSRLALMDSFLLVFGFAGLALFFASRAKQYDWMRLVFTGLLLGLSVSVKWTGLSFLGLMGSVYAYDVIAAAWRERSFHILLARLGKAVLCFLIVPLIVYYAVFAVHFHLLTHPGQGDAYMDQGFWKLPVVGKFIELNDKMYFYNTTLKAEHPYGSPAWTWPFMVRPIYYWVGEQTKTGVARIYLLGNPVVWFLGACGVVFGLFIDKKEKQKKFLYAVLLAGYVMNFLPFFDITRVLFLYHYLAALVFSLALFMLWLSDVTQRMSMRKRAVIFSCIGLAVVAGFVYFSPLSYGLPLSDSAYHLRTWMKSWI